MSSRVPAVSVAQSILNLRSGNMKILWLLLMINAAFAQRNFGSSTFKKSELCRSWRCVNSKFGFSDSLPPKNQLGTLLRSVLPADWHAVVDTTVQTCYHARPRRYSNNCPGQAILHCVVDQLIANCPESYQKKEDACAPVGSLAGFRDMFTQGRYEDVERNMSVERRPTWFVKNYFSSKCCNLPSIVNATLLSECGFTTFIRYYENNPTIQKPGVMQSQRRLRPVSAPSTPAPTPDNGDSSQVNTNGPLDCCDLSEFILPKWRQECNFHLFWAGQSRLDVNNAEPQTTAAPQTSVTGPAIKNYITTVPQSCEKETCVFTTLNIIRNGSVDMDAFTRLLDNLTTSQPSWTSAKGRALTTCVNKPLQEYTEDCEINKVLACTFDVMTENCPNAKKNDTCKHSTTTDRLCQISSSKYRPKNRREICILPELVDRQILRQCGLTSLSKTVTVPHFVPKPNSYKPVTSTNKCKDLTPSTTCLLSKMGVLNKYGFLDYFMMKDRIRNYTANKDPTVDSVCMYAFNSDLLYKEHCNSPRKLLNLLDSMLLTCPVARRKNTTQCATLYDQVYNSPINRTLPREYGQLIINHLIRVLNPSGQPPTKPKKPKAFPQNDYIKKVKTTPIYHYGILNDNNAPKVTTIDLKPKPKPVVQKMLIEKPPLVLLPVYMRIPQSNLVIRRPFIENGVMRGFFIYKPTNNAYIFNQRRIPITPISTQHISNSPVSTISTQHISNTPISTISTQHISNTPVSTISTQHISNSPVSTISTPHISNTPVSTISTQHISYSPVSTISTSHISNTPVPTLSTIHFSTTRPFSTIFNFPKDEKLEMLKPE